LRESHWAGQIGVNRSALREAFVQLEAEGLIERGQATGYVVARLTDADVIEINKLRLALESLAIEQVCGLDHPDLTALSATLDEFERFVAGGYFLGVLEADRRFHEALIEAAGMRRLTALYHRAPLPLVHRDNHTNHQTVWREECYRTTREHRGILECLVARDANGAKQTLARHLARSPQSPSPV
jgi:DNA-binding GntR family transcriptional regulator